MLSFDTDVRRPPPSPPEMPSYTEANHWHLNVSNSFSKPGSNVTVIVPSVISMKAHKHLQMEEHRTYCLGMCNAAMYLMNKTVMLTDCCPSCSKKTPLLVQLKKLMRNRKSFPHWERVKTILLAAEAVSRVCCLRLCLLGQMQPKANKMTYRLTTMNLMICNCRMKYLYEIYHFTYKNSRDTERYTNDREPTCTFV